MGKEPAAEILLIEGREVRVTNPDKAYFSRQTKLSKLDIVRYYLSIAPGALAGIQDRPIVLKRFVNGAEGEAFYQKRAPTERPSWLRTTTLSFPSGRTAEELVVDDAAGLAWIVNLGCIELHPHPVRSGDLDHPDELRVDLDPGPGVNWTDVRIVALEVKALLEQMGLRGWPKTSGSRGMHVNVRIQPRWTFTEVRRSALALSREVERRVPSLASSKWWKEERHGVFLDYNQNAKDRTTCSAYSVRPLPDVRASIHSTSLERGSRLRPLPTLPYSRFRSVSRRTAIRTLPWTAHQVHWKNCSSSRPEMRPLALATHPGSPALPQDGKGEAPRVAPARAPSPPNPPRRSRVARCL